MMVGRRRYVVIVVVAALLGAVLAGIFSWSRGDQYRATTRLFFTSAAANVMDIYEATLAGQQRVLTYQVLASDPELLADAADRAGTSVDMDTLGRNLHVDVPPGTIIMDISVDNADPAVAAGLANAVADELISTVDQLERPLGGGPPTVALTVVQEAVPSSKPVAKLDLVFVALGAAAGLVLGGLIAAALALLHRLRSGSVSRPDPPQAEALPADDDVDPDAYTLSAPELGSRRQ
jgi:capsular polysaccharide biosynthesis protein